MAIENKASAVRLAVSHMLAAVAILEDAGVSVNMDVNFHSDFIGSKPEMTSDFVAAVMRTVANAVSQELEFKKGPENGRCDWYTVKVQNGYCIEFTGFIHKDEV